MASTRKQIEQAILDAINASSSELRRDLQAVPEKVADTVRAFTPVLTGETKASIEVKTRKTALKKLSTRKTKLGTVYSDDDPAKIAALEYGRGADDEHGATPEFAMFRRAAAIWRDVKL
ncbi:hypothetical protein QN239_26815 [Mycolicibacterium sp. Y3]